MWGSEFGDVRFGRGEVDLREYWEIQVKRRRTLRF